MGVLDFIKKSEQKAPRILIYGNPGIGKSTLASKFPNPLFVLTEETGLSGVDSLPVANTFHDFWGYIEQLLLLDNIPYKTIVIDSVSRLDALVVDMVLKSDAQVSNKKALSLASACGGYGAGYDRAAAVHRGLKSKLNLFQEKGISVVFVSHTAVKTHKAPDADDYDIYTVVANHDKTRSVYIDDCDAVLFCKMRSMINETESGRHIVKSLDQRVLMTGVNPVNVSKNRYGMPDEIPMTFDAISQYIDFYKK